jgi:hypothetical protein
MVVFLSETFASLSIVASLMGLLFLLEIQREQREAVCVIEVTLTPREQEQDDGADDQHQTHEHLQA